MAWPCPSLVNPYLGLATPNPYERIMIISGKATEQGTQQLAARFSGLAFNPLGKTELVVSQAGFGGYRIEAGNETHQAALRHALRQGINLIDTSSNYADGRSEELVGWVVGELVEREELEREELVIVSKAGYLQGENYLRAVQRKQAGNPFPNVVKYAQGLDHCIHPEFLADQLTRSLERLNLDCIDVYLLHNPEYYLSWGHRTGIPVTETRRMYYRRIETAFEYLETEVARGRIQYYGISSNTFPAPANDPTFTSLDKVWAIAEEVGQKLGHGLTRVDADKEEKSAESFDRLRTSSVDSSPAHHFRVVQMPLNLLETGAVTEGNQPDGATVLAAARQRGLAVLVNRLLNAIKNDSLTRLVDVLPPNYPTDPAEVTTAVTHTIAREEQFHHHILPAIDTDADTKKQLQEYLSVGLMLQGRWGGFRTYQNWIDVQNRFLLPRLQNAVNYLVSLPTPPPDLVDWLDGYVDGANETLAAVGAFYQAQAAAEVKVLRGTAVLADPDWQADSLSQAAVRALRSTAGVTSVLVGMRRPAYVDDVIAELKRPVEIKNRVKSWENLKRDM